MKVMFFVAVLATRLSLADSVWSDSGIKGPKYAELLTTMEKWKTDYTDLVTVVDYGKTKQNRTLRMVAVMKKGRFVERQAMLITGSIHGNEYLNIEDRLPLEVLKRANESGDFADYLNRGGAFLFVPIVNPDGYDNRTRENTSGVDLNRDWDVEPVNFKGFKEIETRQLADALDRLKAEHGLTFKVTVDYHCCIGALLHPWSYENAPELPTEVLSAHKKIGELVNQHLKVEVGTTGEILGYYPLGTTKDYYWHKYGALSFTYEGKYSVERRYLAEHVKWWQEVARYLNISHAVESFASILPKAFRIPMKAE